MNVSIKGIVFDGQKSVRLEDLPEEAWQYVTGKSEDGDEVWRKVPWLRRGITLRAQAVASMPFAIYRKKKEITNSGDYEDPTDGALPYPKRMLWLVETSLTRYGRAYFHLEKNLVKTLNLRYFAPTSITPKIDQDKGLTHFERRLGNQTKPIPVDDMVYFWLPDEDVELGPPLWSPGFAAIEAANVLRNVDVFAATFFDRGAIKATLLTTSTGTPKTERERLKSWWQKIARGIKTAWTTEIINADAVKPVEIGEGIQSLANTSLTKEKREDIATGLGVPQTKLFSNAANYATASEDDRAFAEETTIPECEFIEETLNEQFFQRYGLTLKFQPEKLTIFQKEEQDRSGAFVNYINGGLKRSVVAEMLGLSLPNGVEYADLDPDPSEAPAPPTNDDKTNDDKTPPPSNVIEETDPTKQKATDLDKWQRKALKRLKNGLPAVCDFDSDVLPPNLQAAILGALETAKTVADVRAAFKGAIWSPYP